MIKFNKIEEGFVPYSGSRGMKALAIHYEMETIALDKVYTEDELQKIVADKLLEIETANPLAFDKAMRSKIHFVFIGNGLEKEIYNYFSTIFFEQLALTSLNKQKEDSVAVHKMRPPFFVFVGKPEEATGSRDFYGQFNYVVVKAPIKEVNIDKPFDTISFTGIIEMLNHNFSQLVFDVDSKTDFDIIEKVYFNGNLPINPDRTIIIATKEVANEAQDFAEKHGLRLDYDLGNIYTKTIKF